MNKDSKNHSFLSVPMGNGEKVRITRIEPEESWTNQVSLRVQIEGEDGHLRQGPEFSSRLLGDVVKAMIELTG